MLDKWLVTNPLTDIVVGLYVYQTFDQEFVFQLPRIADQMYSFVCLYGRVCSDMTSEVFCTDINSSMKNKLVATALRCYNVIQKVTVSK